VSTETGECEMSVQRLLFCIILLAFAGALVPWAMAEASPVRTEWVLLDRIPGGDACAEPQW
jgi:hypothetical protein